MQQTTLAPAQDSEPSLMMSVPSMVYYGSFYELTEQADIVIIGQAQEAKEIVNAARVPGDPAKPDADHFGVGQIYEVRVDEYQKGDGPKII
jgi:hypothetical protein